MIHRRELFEHIFGDAHVVDIDLSAWDKRISLYVLAEHVGRTSDNRLPMFIAEFSRVHSLNIEFNHLAHHPPIELDPDEHVQWRIDEYEIERVEVGLRITLFQRSSSPRMSIVCEDVNIWEISYDSLSMLFPGWSKPGTGFIRPGPDVMLGYGLADRLQGREYADRRLLGKKKGRR